MILDKDNCLDFTTYANLKIIDDVVATTEFNSSEYDSWRRGFREAITLCKNQNQNNNIDKLLIWVTQSNAVKFAEHARNGAICGLDYYRYFSDNDDLLKCVDNFSWLNIRFKYATCYTSDIPEIITREDLCRLLKIPYSG